MNAYSLLSVLLGAVLALVGLLLKAALAVAVGVFVYRQIKPKHRGLEVVVVPPPPFGAPRR